MLNKHCKFALATAGALSTMLFVGCTDDSYDLDNIDTTMQFEINDLTLPLNLAPIQFDDMVDLTDEECIDVVDGEYVLVKKGTFESEEINIRNIHSDAIDDGNDDYNQHIASVVPGIAVPFLPYDYRFSYSYNNVDKYIKKIVSGKVDLTLSIHFDTRYDDGRPFVCEFNDLVLSLPKGFYGTVSDGQVIGPDSSNEVSISSATTDANGQMTISYHVTSFDFAQTGATLNGQLFNLSTSMGIKAGTFRAVDGNGNAGSIALDFTISELDVRTFTGCVYYMVENLDPEDLMLNNLPDVLTDEKSDIRLKNPQLYVKLANPLADYDVEASTGITITQIRPEGSDIITAQLVKPLEISAQQGQQNFCLSPIEPGKFIADFEGSKWNEMTNLGNIVSGKGLPEGLKINFIDPQMNETDVTDFRLGQNLGTVHGDYTFFAPLDLSNGSHIYYEDEASGWGLGGGDEKMEISTLSLTADVVSNLPVAVTLSAKPIDENGLVITGVRMSTVDIPAFGKCPIEIRMDGTIIDLDGMKYTLTVKAGENTSALRPTQSLTLNNLKIRVSGKYIVDEEDDDEF